MGEAKRRKQILGEDYGKAKFKPHLYINRSELSNNHAVFLGIEELQSSQNQSHLVSAHRRIEQALYAKQQCEACVNYMVKNGQALTEVERFESKFLELLNTKFNYPSDDWVGIPEETRLALTRKTWVRTLAVEEEEAQRNVPPWQWDEEYVFMVEGEESRGKTIPIYSSYVTAAVMSDFLEEHEGITPTEETREKLWHKSQQLQGKKSGLE